MRERAYVMGWTPFPPAVFECTQAGCLSRGCWEPELRRDRRPLGEWAGKASFGPQPREVPPTSSGRITLVADICQEQRDTSSLTA